MYIYIIPDRERAVGRRRKRVYSAAWYAGFREGSLRLEKMNDEVPFEDDPAWLTLPMARREVALHRRGVMLAYERHENPGESEAQQAARNMGVTTGQFYRLRRQWKEKRSIFSLIPYGRPGTIKKPKLDPEVQATVHSLTTAAIKGDGVRSPAEILRRIRADWPLEKPVPSHMTLRKNIDQALAEIEDIAGNVALKSRKISAELIGDATSYGDLIAIDHVGLKLFVAQPLGPTAPMITLAIDVFTSSICGFHLFSGYPGPDQVTAVMRDAEARTAISGPGNAEPLHPHLVFELGSSDSWKQLADKLENRGIAIWGRMHSDIIPFGDITNRLIGRSIGDVRLSARKQVGFRKAFDPERDPLVSIEELRVLLTKGVEELNQKRIPAALARRPLQFGL